MEENLYHFKGIKISRTSPAISHLLYADDLQIFCRSTKEDMHAINYSLSKFSLWSSQSPNHSKSLVHFSKNTKPRTKLDILNILNFKECDHKAQHLGLPFCSHNSRKTCFKDLNDRISTKLSGWKAKNPSQAGRGVLIKVVSQALPTYPMSIFLLPKSLCLSMDAALKKFWWGSNSNGNSLMLKCWDSICLPKSSGGLGFRRMMDTNRALLSKLAWKMANPSNNLWRSLLASSYLISSNFLHYSPYPQNASWSWKDICKSKDLILKGACYTICSNSKSSFGMTLGSLPSLVSFPLLLQTIPMP